MLDLRFLEHLVLGFRALPVFHVPKMILYSRFQFGPEMRSLASVQLTELSSSYLCLSVK